MNERIKELLQEAYTHFGHGKYRTPELVAEKFAELIVRECIKKVELRKEFAIEDEHNVDEAFSLLVYDIEEHFGIDE
jgi:hypothetical protein